MAMLVGLWLRHETCRETTRSGYYALLMAWSCSGTTNAELISNLLRNRLINSDTVAAVRALPPPRLTRRPSVTHVKYFLPPL